MCMYIQTYEEIGFRVSGLTRGSKREGSSFGSSYGKEGRTAEGYWIFQIGLHYSCIPHVVQDRNIPPVTTWWCVTRHWKRITIVLWCYVGLRRV